jgi:hypothetical protein
MFTPRIRKEASKRFLLLEEACYLSTPFWKELPVIIRDNIADIADIADIVDIVDIVEARFSLPGPEH